MPIITSIIYKEDKDRYWIYIDNQYCASVRARTFKAMNLKKGDHITCQELKDRENFFWKQAYSSVWEDEKLRLNKVVQLVRGIDPKIKIKVEGFGADSNEIIEYHPDESGKPDLVIEKDNNILMYIEVTGTNTMRGSDYWVRPDKLEYAQNHPDENVWIILHYAEPIEKFVFIKPELNKKYEHVIINIRGADEYYVIFNDKSPAVHSFDFFRKQFNNH